MKNLFKKVKGVLLVGLAAAMFSTSAYGAEAGGGGDQGDISSVGGSFCKNAVTGEIYYIPEPDIDAHSDESFGFSPGYDPFADEDNGDDNSLQPYYLDSGRTRVDNPQYNEMCRNTVYIETKYIGYINGEETTFYSGGTGFMIGPNAVATAGHVLYNKDEFGGDHWITESTIIPAYNSGSNPMPFGSAKGIEYRCGWDWANNNKYSDDWGIITLDQNIGNKVGWLGLQYQSKPYASGTSVRVNGYPETVNGRDNKPIDMYTRMGTVGASSITNLLESNDMYASSGDSGSPCYIYSSTNGYTAIGIASNVIPINKSEENISGVRFRTIDKALYTKLVEFRTSTLNG